MNKTSILPPNDWIWYALAAFILAGYVWSSPANADTKLYLGGLSDHPFSDEDYNERHKLVLLQHNGWVGGYTNNSYDEDLFIAGYKWHVGEPVKHVEVGAVLAATYGYRSCIKGWADANKRVCGMGALQFDYTQHDWLHPSVVVTPVFVMVTMGMNF